MNTTRDRDLTDLSAIQLYADRGQALTEDGTSSGHSRASTSPPTVFYDGGSAWAHHWSEFSRGSNGAGVMFTNASNFKLYTFDGPEYAGDATGALYIEKQASETIGHIEVNPVERYQVTFTNALDVIWYGAVVTFDSEPIYSTACGNSGLWVLVEYPPVVEVA